MGREDSYKAAVAMASLYGELYKYAAQEIGEEKIVAFHGLQSSESGKRLVREIKNQLSGRELDPRTLLNVFSTWMEEIGTNYTVEEKQVCLTFSVIGCTQYDGFTAAGLSHKEVESTCFEWERALIHELTSVFPLEVDVIIRSRADNPCTATFKFNRGARAP